MEQKVSNEELNKSWEDTLKRIANAPNTAERAANAWWWFKRCLTALGWVLVIGTIVLLGLCTKQLVSGNIVVYCLVASFVMGWLHSKVATRHQKLIRKAEEHDRDVFDALVKLDILNKEKGVN